MLDKINKFEIYDVFNMPVPHDKTPNMVASYRLEAVSNAIYLDEMTSVLLNDREEKHCISPLRHYCDIKSPVYSIAPHTLCIIAFFQKDKEKMKNCDSVVRPNSILSKASHIVDGLWFVGTQQIFTFAVVCPEKEGDSYCVSTFRYDKIEHVLFCFKCYLILLLYNHYERKSVIKDHFIEKLKNYNGSQIQIWKPFISSIPNFTKSGIP